MRPRERGPPGEIGSERVTPEFALPWLSLALTTALLAAAAWVALARQRVYAFLLAALAMYGFTTTVELPRLASEFSQQDAITAALVFSIGSLFLLLGAAVAESVVSGGTEVRAEHWRAALARAGNAHLAWSAAATALSLLIIVGSRRSLDVSWSEAREDSGILTVAGVFLFLLSAPGAVTGFLIGRRKLAAATLVGGLFTFAFCGSRAGVLGGLAFLAWMSFIRTESAKARFRLFLTVATVAFVAHVALRFVRGVGPLGLVTAVRDGNVWDLVTASGVGEDLSGGEEAIARFFVFSVHVAGDKMFGFMSSVQRLVLLFIPRGIPGISKPMDVTYQLWDAAFTSGLLDDAAGFELLRELFITGNLGSVHPTLFGELFVSGRWVALVLSSLVYGGTCVFIDRALLRMADVTALLLIGPVIVGMVFVGRGNSVIGFGYFFYLGVTIWAAAAVVRLLASFRANHGRRSSAEGTANAGLGENSTS
jgi:hypothetical protein